MSEEEDAAAILDCVVGIGVYSAAISGALSTMTGKQKQETREAIEAARFCMASAANSAGVDNG